MDHSCMARVTHVDVGTLQTICIGTAFAAQRIEFGSVHVRRRLTRDVFRAQRREARIRQIQIRGTIMFGHPVESRLVEEIAGGQGAA